MVAFAGVEAKGVVQGGALAAALAVVPLLAEVVGIWVDAQEAHQRVQLSNSILHAQNSLSTKSGAWCILL